MDVKGLLARWRGPEKREAPAPGPAPAPPLRRAVPAAHHWLTVRVLRNDAPVPGARVVLRPYGPGDRLLDPVARAPTDASGEAALLLPAGRYAVSVGHGGDAKCVNVAVAREGRVLVHLEATGRRVVLTVEAGVPDVAVEARFVPGGHLAARGWTDERGVAALLVPPGEVEVTAAGAAARVRVAGDDLVRLPRPAGQGAARLPG